ncbi:MAG TPA: ABC transporter ATP-binding protein [Verrucomicrobiales bacterium]|nr:ABC transporter ATP-binding protein [Verrucomicrobiales bacterium]
MPLLEITNLRKDFRSPAGGVHPVVRIPRFTLGGEEQVALRGESGSGKTTFLNLIAGILKPDSGSLVLAGREMSAMGEPERDSLRAGTIGYIFQTFNLLQGHTALENVLLGMSFGPGEDRAHAAALLRRVGLGDRLHHRPRELSTGQQQRVAVARALAARPKLVLADEPTGNLDQVRSREALALIREACRENGAALLLVSHDPGVLGEFEDVRDFRTLNQATPEAAQ